MTAALRVGTYNLWVAHWPATATYDRLPLVRAALDRVDVLGTQEGTSAHLAALTEGTGFAAVGRSRDGDGAGEHSAILYRTARVAVEATGDFWLSPTPDVPSTGWDATRYRRLCTWARLRDRTTGSTFALLNAHLDHEGARARVESARLLLARAAEVAGDGPVVLTGDLNAEPGSEPLRVLLAGPAAGAGGAATRGRLVDARAASATPPSGPSTTFTELVDPDGPAPGPGAPRRRIDHVLVSPDVAVEAYAVLDARPGGRHPSDHDPVVATLRLPAPVAA
ncbi:endonuclease/exonuclease/phosphatase family protein [Cellulomonas sp. ACRRI]|uniref:endonuclease/exonuclease/phosphatase family protein n=1 Tax=Cellulomonas sp. ACRRI TaxID=2918188 RepID=UPI001EF373EE|nr:endonuclease/exonuclease/phosphatase family protein [Cellulomonas sp. ACRRI]MCG7285500.1 endonuclease/exonuclease/phosphatase family protein [Cellulomonas sp. ACRRI]